MSLLIESIKLYNGAYHNLFYHEQRMNRSLKMLCGVEDYFNLEEFLQHVEQPTNGLFKCRIVYDDESKSVEYIPYIPRLITTLRVIEHDRISYEFKYSDRKTIDKLFELRQSCDDILIVKRGLVTDTSYANILFKRDAKWYTPYSPLLKGTMRANLLEHEKIEEEEIHVNDIKTYDSFKLINALLEFEGSEVDVSNIVF